MKKVVLITMLGAMPLFFACKKRVSVSSNTNVEKLQTMTANADNPVVKYLESIEEGLSSDLFEHFKLFKIYNADKSEFVEVVATSPDGELLNNYVLANQSDFVVEFHNAEEYLANKNIPDPVVIDETEGEGVIDNPSELTDMVRLIVLDNNLPTTQLLIFKLGDKYKHGTSKTFKIWEEWSSTKNKMTVNWGMNTLSGNDIRVKIRYKTCALCLNKHILVDNVFLYQANPTGSWEKVSRRNYIEVSSNWGNREVLFY